MRKIEFCAVASFFLAVSSALRAAIGSSPERDSALVGSNESARASSECERDADERRTYFYID